MEVESESGYNIEEKDSEKDHGQDGKNESPESHNRLLLNANIRTTDPSSVPTTSSPIHSENTYEHKDRNSYISQEDLNHRVEKVYRLIEIYHGRCAIVHSGCQDMDPQGFFDHLNSLQEQITFDLLTFPQPNGKEFVLEAINELSNWYFYEDEGKWYYQDESSSIPVRVRYDDEDEHEDEDEEEDIVKEDVEED